MQEAAGNLRNHLPQPLPPISLLQPNHEYETWISMFLVPYMFCFHRRRLYNLTRQRPDQR
jgi:hypothetical protein